VQLQGCLQQIVRNAKILFPNLKICYLSSRTRAYVYGAGLNPEPYAYETAFAVKWLIEKQLAGAPALNFDPGKGPVLMPWLSWGPYLWTDGLRGRSDGVVTVCPDDLESDFTHPSMNGHVPKVGQQLLAFFKTDPTATPWFLRGNAVGQPPSCAPSADVTSGILPLTVNFRANASRGGASIRDYQWTFEDGMFSTNQNPTKCFPAPGTYHARLTVTDTNGNTAGGVVAITVAAARLESGKVVGHQFQFFVNGATNVNHIVQRCTDFTNWLPVQTDRGPFTFTEPGSNIASRLFRTVSTP
jgi:hypothetical protein